MESQLISSALKGLIGHLNIETTEDKRNLNLLKRSLSKSEISDQSKASESAFSIEKTDLFSDDSIPEEQKKSINTILSKRVKTNETTNYKVFRREVPVREQLLYNSVADWAAGSKVDHSLGPFTGNDGRKFWYDFYPIEKLVTLYMQGITEPVLLFKIKQSGRLTAITNAPVRASLTKTYSLGKGTIWINSKFLAPNSPSATYTGLLIKDGKITLNQTPQDVNNKLTVPAGTNVSVSLNLDQPKVTDADTNSEYGKDAREMQLQLPETLSFHFSANGRTIDNVGNASWNLYGQKIQFEWMANQQTVYDTQLQRIFFPFKSSEQNVVIQKNESDFHKLSKEAAIQKSGWILPVAAIDISQPTAAAGIGEMLVQCKNGLINKWVGLNGGSFSLNKPAILVGPGQVLITDLTAGNPHATQILTLWKDEMVTTINLSFSEKVLFFYVSNAGGNELLMTNTNADFRIDRPVKVDGVPPAIQSLNSLLIITASDKNKLIYLFDDNLILDNAQINNQDPVVPEQMALALTNALFKVTQPNGCLLFGNFNDDFSKVEKGFLFLTFGLLAYIPTLPDPYAANLGIMQRQIRGTTKVNVRGAASLNQQITAWLVCRIAWADATEEDNDDTVNVSFHFGPLNNQFGEISLDTPEEEIPNESISASPSGSPGDINIQPSRGSIINTDADIAVSRLANLNFSSRNLKRTSKVVTATENINFAAFSSESEPPKTAAAVVHPKELPEYGPQWDGSTSRYKRDLFALLDVSTNADLFGISFDLLSQRGYRVTVGTDTTTGESISNFFPVQVEGMNVVSAGANVKAFTVPQISWEPVFNLSPPAPPPDGPFRETLMADSITIQMTAGQRIF